MSESVQASRVIPANEAEIWETLTSRDGMKTFMMGADVEADWRIGGPIVMRGEYNGKRFEDRGEVRSFERWRRLSYTHTSSAAPDQTHLVTIELERKGDGTEVTVTQQAVGDKVAAEDQKHRAEYQKTWAAMLAKLEDATIN